MKAIVLDKEGKERKADIDYLIGIDLGKKIDFTAVLAVERTKLYNKISEFGEELEEEKPTYRLFHTERSQMDFTIQVLRIANFLHNLRKTIEPNLLPEAHDTYNPHVLVDIRGVGDAISDNLKKELIYGDLCYYKPVMVHGGESTKRKDGYWSLSKTDMVTASQVVHQDKRLFFEKDELTDTLIEEMMNFRVKVHSSGHIGFESWRVGIHDDMVFALCMCLWWGEQLDKHKLKVFKKNPFNYADAVHYSSENNFE